LVSLVLRGIEGIEQIKKVCIALGKAGAKVNKSCGFHLHLGANDLTIDNFKTLVKSHINLENAFDAIMPESRRGNTNTFCRIMSSVANVNRKVEASNTVRELTQAYNSRYFKLNLQSYLKYGTV